MDLKLTARSKVGPEEYSALSDHGLRAESSQTPEGICSQITVRISADRDFSGVIRFALGSGGNPASAR